MLVLKLLGIDIKIFKEDSKRSISTSEVGGPTIDEIFKRGNWSDECTCQTFFNNPVDHDVVRCTTSYQRVSTEKNTEHDDSEEADLKGTI